MICLTALFVLLPSEALGAPGRPGAAWSPAEVARTKERIWNILLAPNHFISKTLAPEEHGVCGTDCWKDCDAFDRSREHPFCTHCDDVICPKNFPKCQCCRGWCDAPYGPQGPNAAKMLRLSFHDCLKYEDGTGGCDGCLDWSGMGIRYQKKNQADANGPYDYTFDDPGDINNGKGDNNGLESTVLALEHVFKDSNLGDNRTSLLEGGKSRADLWAFAAIVAVEFSVNENNLACSAATLPWAKKDRTGSGCGRRDMETEECFVRMPQIPFRTGRTDCTPGAEPYVASQTEVHPSPFGNGPMTLKWFKEYFGFTDPKEVVALMGAHTLGKLDQRHTFMKYWWNRGEHSYFNNQYYKAMVDPTDYALQCMEEAKAGFWLTGMPDSTPGKVTFKAHGRGWFKSGGPFSWQRNLDLCYDGGLAGPSGMNKLLENFATEAEANENCFNPANQLVDGGPAWICNSTCFTPDDFVDEAMLNSDLGLYFEFNVDPKTGRQLGYNSDGTVTCPGLVDEIDESEAWFSGTRIHATAANCGKAATANLVEAYAKNQASWVADFGSVFDKMLTNGYDVDNLDMAEYGCCTRVPPSMHESRWVSKVQCDPEAMC